MKPLAMVAAASLAVLSACASQQKAQAENGRQVRLSLGAQMAQKGDWAGAFKIADALVQEDPEDANAWLLRSKALRKQGMPVEAEADVRKALRLEPSNAMAHSELAILCERSARPEQALEEHKEAKRLSPFDPRYQNNLAFAYVLRGKPREAIPLLEEALRTAPGSQLLRNNLGFAFAASGEFGRAAEQFRLAGTPVQAKVNLGYAYERSGNLVQAWDSYVQALRLDPEDAAARGNLEHVSQRMGRELPPELAHGAGTPGEKGGT